MKQNKSISAIKSGMSRDVHISQLQNTEYSFLLNGDSGSEIGDEYNIQNEPSNYFGVQFPEGYKVIGFKSNVIQDETYYFLTNTETKKSSIGYVKNQLFDNSYNQDELTDCTDCLKLQKNLGEALENIVQSPSLTYVELVNDICHSIGQGLNFDINFPIKNIQIKEEKLGTTLYFDDYKNPSRYINVTNIKENPNSHYLITQEVPCEDDEIVNCIIIDKLLLFPKYNRLIIKPETLQTGGNLKLGTYEFWVAYCDSVGNALSEYFTPTQPVRLFDENNNILAQNQTDEFTNFAIKLKIENLDSKAFEYYKVVCVERNNVNNTSSPFLEGIHPTTDDTVVYTQSGSFNDDVYVTRGNVNLKKRIDFSELLSIKPNFEKFKGNMTSGGRLLHFGTVEKRELNIQPVVNLFSSLLKWQTVVAKEDLYKSPIATSLYTGYRRDEVQAFSLRLLYKDGGYSPNFPLIGRPAKSTDLTVVSDTNFNSINSNTPNCTINERNKKWQIFNTAEITDEELCTDIESSGIEVEQNVVKTCVIENVAIVTTNTITLEVNEDFTTIKDYVEDNPDIIIPGITDALNEEYEDDHCSPNFLDVCDTPRLTNFFNEIGTENNVVSQNIEKLSTEYVKSIPPKFCNQFKINTSTGAFRRDNDFENLYMPCTSGGRDWVYFRDSDFLNEDCLYAEDVLNKTNPTQTGIAYNHNYYGSYTLATLLTTKDVDASSINTYFKNKLHKGALYFKIEKNNRDKIVFEITKNSVCDSFDDIPFLNNLRYNIYSSCSSTTSLTGGIVDTTQGILEILDTTSFPDIFYVAIDAPIQEELIQLQECGTCGGFMPPCTFNTVFKVAPPCGCFSVFTRDIEISAVEVTWDSITINKIEEYKSLCIFTLPKVDECEPKAFKKGIFSYWESTEEYPDNKELYDSSNLFIKESDLNNLSEQDRLEFIEYYTDGIDAETGNYILKNNTDFTCEKIRHFKFPDNKTAPFIYDNIGLQENSDSYIFPLGVNLDSEVVISMLNVAKNNNLITTDELNNISGYEILRGDNSIHKSVIGNGLGFDLYKYNKGNEDWWYPNYPFNDLGKDKFNLQTPNGSLIEHPYSSDANHMFSVISPDLLLTKPSLPTEVSLTGYQFGVTDSRTLNLEEHPKWTILGRKARNTATQLAILEVALEIAIKTTEFITQGGAGNLWFVAGFTNGTNAAGAGISSGATIAYIALSAVNGVTKLGEYRYNWLKIFDDLGKLDNFANYQVATGKYNKFVVNTSNDDYLRGLPFKKYLKDGRYNSVDESTGDKININNWLREYSTVFSTGEDFKFNYISDYKNFDNSDLNSNSSRYLSSEASCEKDTNFFRDIASPYFTLKNYIPDQWGTIDSIKWLTTNHIFSLDEDTTCKTIFGGTVSISRFTWKRKIPFFRSTVMGQADKLAFNYSEYGNIGYPRFYCDYKTDSIFSGFLIPFPDIDSDFNFDCTQGDRDFYLKSPSKIYLYSYGIVDFLVESEINCNFRHAKKELKDNFYPQNPDIENLTQESKLSITEPNTFYYNNTYSLPVSNSNSKLLPRTYNEQEWDKLRVRDNLVIYSERDYNENDSTDPWKIYKPLNQKEFNTSNGKIVGLTDIESEQFIIRYENRYSLHNAIDNLADRITPQNKELGTGGLFAERPIEPKVTELGFAGTQHNEICSTPYGHFWVDAKRGRIIQIDQSGRSIDIVSEQVGKEVTKMKQWFKEHLPFKILRYIPNLDIDNKFKGIGINIWYDDRKSRVFFTKKDYILKQGINKNNFEFDLETKQLFYNDIEVFFDNTTSFKEVSWTISYKPTEGKWNSYFSFYPDYSPYHNNFFQIGFNWGTNKETLWNHTLDNKSFQVFQGVLNPFIIEYPIQNTLNTKLLNSISLNIEAKRYQDDWDFSIWKGIGFNKFSIFNNTQHTGILNLFEQKTLSDIKKYPKTNSDGTQDILYTSEDGKHNINYFFNRVVNQDNNISIWNKDENNIFKTLNSQAVRMYGKSVLERMKSDNFIVSLTNDKESRFNIILKNSINDETIEQ